MLLNEKCVIATVSIEIMFFLIGTMFEMNLVAQGKDDEGSPWDKVWTTISELQSEIPIFESC